MKSIFISDLHLTNFKKDKLDKETMMSEKLSYIKKNLYKCIDLYREKQCDNIVIAGDVFNDKEVLYGPSLNTFQQWLEDVKNEKIQLIIIQGNHDSVNYDDPSFSLLNFLTTYENVTVVYDYYVQENCIFTGYKKEEEYIELLSRIIETYGESENMTLIGHFDINGARLSNGAFSHARLNLKSLGKYFKTIISGHIHKPQIIQYNYKGEDDGNFIYIGSPIQINWGEKDEKKRLIYFDSNTHKYESIPCDFKNHTVIKIENKEDLQNIETLLENIDMENSVVKIISSIEIPDEDVRNKISDKNVSLFIDTAVARKRDVENAISLSDTDIEKYRKYMEIKKIPKEDRDKYIEVLFKYNII